MEEIKRTSMEVGIQEQLCSLQNIQKVIKHQSLSNSYFERVLLFKTS